MGFNDPSTFLASAGYVIEIQHVPTGKKIEFKGWVTNFSDSYESNWNTEDAYGRMDPIATFQNTRRSINLEWDVVAASVSEAKKNMAACSVLFRLLYPVYSAGGDNASNLLSAPLFRFKFGNLICRSNAGANAGVKEAGLLGTMSGFEYSPDFDAGFFTVGRGEMYPQAVSLSAEFAVLHDHPLGYSETGLWRDGETQNYPYGEYDSNVEGQSLKGKRGSQDADWYNPLLQEGVAAGMREWDAMKEAVLTGDFSALDEIKVEETAAQLLDQQAWNNASDQSTPGIHEPTE